MKRESKSRTVFGPHKDRCSHRTQGQRHGRFPEGLGLHFLCLPLGDLTFSPLCSPVCPLHSPSPSCSPHYNPSRSMKSGALRSNYSVQSARRFHVLHSGGQQRLAGTSLTQVQNSCKKDSDCISQGWVSSPLPSVWPVTGQWKGEGQVTGTHVGRGAHPCGWDFGSWKRAVWVVRDPQVHSASVLKDKKKSSWMSESGWRGWPVTAHARWPSDSSQEDTASLEAMPTCLPGDCWGHWANSNQEGETSEKRIPNSWTPSRLNLAILFSCVQEGEKVTANSTITSFQRTCEIWLQVWNTVYWRINFVDNLDSLIGSILKFAGKSAGSILWLSHDAVNVKLVINDL